MLTQNIGQDNPLASQSDGQLVGKSKSSKPSMKEMSKAEGRAIQEKQRADKAILKGSPAVSASPKQPTGKALNNPPTAARPPGSNSASKKNPIDPIIDFPPSLKLFLHLESPVNTLTGSQSGLRVDPIKKQAARTRTRLEVGSCRVGSAWVFWGRRLPEPNPQPVGSRVSPGSTQPIYILTFNAAFACNEGPGKIPINAGNQK
ncbi:hypothetical protein PSTG_03214 [Puccinia striiformis f. sp. tritici PST-78]|uniref:Uncharacterized protein n=1 Tax=Puccinia striiformis f. sp. tritici PST-78 TaxID=1165861 RepID=A0A0L0VWP7_9BASI|nr:hypothetical protein PSTG_03214 [Puccinia striiformis f. sp. tritici PST-78]